jgi:hypothetical protein
VEVVKVLVEAVLADVVVDVSVILGHRAADAAPGEHLSDIGANCNSAAVVLMAPFFLELIVLSAGVAVDVAAGGHAGCPQVLESETMGSVDHGAAACWVNAAVLLLLVVLLQLSTGWCCGETVASPWCTMEERHQKARRGQRRPCWRSDEKKQKILIDISYANCSDSNSDGTDCKN